MRYLTAGESHGSELVTILDDVPSGVSLDSGYIDNELGRRQGGYGRGARMKIEKDTAEIVSGVRNRKTNGSPITIVIKNKDWENWKNQSYKETIVTLPRPGHADLSGVLKYNLNNVRDVLERSSARETAARVSVGAVAKRILDYLDIKFYSVVINIGGSGYNIKDYNSVITNYHKIEKSDVRSYDKKAEKLMKNKIDEAIKNKDTVGGIFEVIINGLPAGLGSFVQWDKKLDANLAKAIMSIQGVKGVEFGMGFEMANRYGSEVHDEIYYSKDNGYYRKSNNAGGIEGGMSNGENIIIRAVMKPIPTLMSPLNSVDIKSKKQSKAVKERSDVCVVPAASVIAENVAAIEILNAVQHKFGSDNIDDIINSYKKYLKRIK